MYKDIKGYALYLAQDSYGLSPIYLSRDKVDSAGGDILAVLEEWIEDNGREAVPFGLFSWDEVVEDAGPDMDIIAENYCAINGGEYFISAPFRLVPVTECDDEI